MRVIAPFAIAALVGAATIALVWWILPAAGVILLVALMLAATALPWLTGRLARRNEARQAQARGELTAAVVDLVRGAPELTVCRAIDRRLDQALALDARLSRIARQGAGTAGIGQGLATLLPALAMVGCLAVGRLGGRRRSPGRGAARRDRGGAAGRIRAGHRTSRRRARRFSGCATRSVRTERVLDADPLVAEPAAPQPVGPGPHRVAVRGLRARYGDAGPWAWTASTSTCRPGRRVAVVGPQRRRQVDAGQRADAAVALPGRVGLTRRSRAVRARRRRLPQASSGWCLRMPMCLTRRLRATCGSRAATPPSNSFAMRWTARGCWTGSTDSRRARPPRWVSTAGASPAASASGWRRRGRCWRTSRCSCSTSLASISTPRPATRSSPTCSRRARERAVLLITHRLAGLEDVDEVIVLEAGRVIERGTHSQLLHRGGRYADMWRREQG